MQKEFDAVAWMRDQRRRIDEEDRDLTWEQKHQRTHEIVMRDRILAGLCDHAVPPERLRPLAVRETASAYRAMPPTPHSPKQKGPS